MSYCYKVAAATRNERVSKGHRRLMRVRGLPTSRFRNRRLVLSSVFPQCLHAAESARVPDSVFPRLRSKATQSLCLDGSGANPWLACSVAAPKNVGPEWNSLVSRIRLFRLAWKDFPNRRDLLQTGLYDHGSRYKSPLRHLVDVLSSFGWSLQPGLVMRDAACRTFHLVLTPLFHVQHLLMVNWGEVVSSKVRHRKGLEELEAVDCDFSRPSPSLQPQERGLLSQLGSTVTSVCPF